MLFWILALSYWLHLLATAVWLGGLAFLVIVALPALRRKTLDDNQWIGLQQALTPWVNGSLVVLLVTGFVQMTNDSNYTGFLRVDSVWAWAMLLKHVAFAALAAVTLYLQWSLFPEIERTKLLKESRPQVGADVLAQLHQREVRLLWINVICAAVILLFTAVMTAV